MSQLPPLLKMYGENTPGQTFVLCFSALEMYCGTTYFIVSRRVFGEPKAGEYLDRTNERAGQYAAACKSVAEELNVGVVDLWTSIQRHSNWQQQCLT